MGNCGHPLIGRRKTEEAQRIACGLPATAPTKAEGGPGAASKAGSWGTCDGSVTAVEALPPSVKAASITATI